MSFKVWQGKQKKFQNITKLKFKSPHQWLRKFSWNESGKKKFRNVALNSTTIPLPNLSAVGKKLFFFKNACILWKCNSQNKRSTQKFTIKKCQKVQKKMFWLMSVLFFKVSFPLPSLTFLFLVQRSGICLWINFLFPFPFFSFLFFPCLFLCLFSLSIFKDNAVFFCLL